MDFKIKTGRSEILTYFLDKRMTAMGVMETLFVLKKVAGEGLVQD
jgi:hypothetical protein